MTSERATAGRLLARISSTPGKAFSGESMGRELSVSRAAVSKSAAGLRDAGYPILTGRAGYALEPDAPVSAGNGVPFHYLGTAESTQDEARTLARNGAPEWTTVLAESQPGGRGRRGRSWHGPAAAGLYFTVVLRPRLPLASLGLLPLAVGVALARAVQAATGIRAGLKWPNDLLAPDGRKLAGVLVEAEAQDGAARFALVGIGLNVRRQEFPAGMCAAALEDLGTSVHRRDLLTGILVELRSIVARLESGDLPAVLESWRELDLTAGREVLVSEASGSTWTGTAAGVNDAGSLVVRAADGTTRTVVAGDVSIRLPNIQGTPLPEDHS